MFYQGHLRALLYAAPWPIQFSGSIAMFLKQGLGFRTSGLGFTGLGG